MTRRIIDYKAMIGQKFGRLTVLLIIKGGRGTKCECICDCGKKVTTRCWRVLHGTAKTCGCSHFDGKPRHGESKGAKQTAEYRIWIGMRRRCYKPSDPQYKYYGLRGIMVCDQWMQYEHFLADMGRRPGPEYSIDRINYDGHYEPGNCRWATPREQVLNCRRTRWIEFNGKRLCFRDWEREFGLVRGALKNKFPRRTTKDENVVEFLSRLKPAPVEGEGK